MWGWPHLQGLNVESEDLPSEATCASSDIAAGFGRSREKRAELVLANPRLTDLSQCIDDRTDDCAFGAMMLLASGQSLFHSSLTRGVRRR